MTVVTQAVDGDDENRMGAEREEEGIGTQYLYRVIEERMSDQSL